MDTQLLALPSLPFVHFPHGSPPGHAGSVAAAVAATGFAGSVLSAGSLPHHFVYYQLGSLV